MVPLLRAARYRWMPYLGAAGVLLSGCFFFPVLLYLDNTAHSADKPSMWTAIACGTFMVLGILSSVTVLFLRGFMNARYDPNDAESEQERIEVGRKRSITREEAEDLLDPVIRRE
jgi:hypothetical protein